MNMNRISPVIEDHTKLADAVLQNERLLLVIERFGISLGFGDKTIIDIAEAYRLNLSLVLAVMNVFNDHTFVVDDLLTEDMIPGLMDYMKQAHRFYLEEKLPFIGGLIERFIENTENPDTRLLQSFFKEYADEVREHMELEDATVFPYIQALVDHARGEKGNRYSFHYCINDFVEHHSDIEEKLEDLTYLLIKHFPPTRDRFYRNQILLELFTLQYDLNDHGGIEDRILVPMVRKLELKTMQNG